MTPTHRSDGSAWSDSCHTSWLAVKQASNGPNKRGERSEDSNWLQLPLTGFGPFLALASNTSQGCHPADSNKWPFGTCTLLSSAKQAKAASAAEGELLLMQLDQQVATVLRAAAAISTCVLVRALHICCLVQYAVDRMQSCSCKLSDNNQHHYVLLPLLLWRCCCCCS
jgi:hypothetical protein